MSALLYTLPPFVFMYLQYLYQCVFSCSLLLVFFFFFFLVVLLILLFYVVVFFFNVNHTNNTKEL